MDLGIREIKEINNILLSSFGVDYSNHSFTSYKNRLINLIKINNYKDSKELIQNISSGKLSFDKFTLDMSIPSSEMFRDPAMWRELRDKILPSIKGKIRIFIPSSTTGEELITLLIILQEEGYIDRAQITVSACSKLIVDRIKQAIFTTKQMELNEANYKRYKGKSELSSYGKSVENKIYFDKIINNTNFIVSRVLDNTKLPTGQDIVLYRNRLIYFNLKMQNDILDKISETIRAGGFLILGTMENLFISEGMDKKFSVFSKSEKIFKKNS